MVGLWQLQALLEKGYSHLSKLNHGDKVETVLDVSGTRYYGDFGRRLICTRSSTLQHKAEAGNPSSVLIWNVKVVFLPMEITIRIHISGDGDAGARNYNLKEYCVDTGPFLWKGNLRNDRQIKAQNQSAACKVMPFKL